MPNEGRYLTNPKTERESHPVMTEKELLFSPSLENTNLYGGRKSPLLKEITTRKRETLETRPPTPLGGRPFRPELPKRRVVCYEKEKSYVEEDSSPSQANSSSQQRGGKIVGPVRGGGPEKGLGWSSGNS